MRAHGLTVSRVTTPPLWLRHDAHLRPRRARATPSGRRGSARSRPRWRATTGSAARCVEAPAVAREQLLAVHPAAYVDFDRGAVRRAAAGAIDARHRTRCAGTCGGGAAGGGRRGRARRRAARRARRATGVSALRPPGHHAEPARAMGFCFFGNVAVAARRATAAHGARAGADRRLGRPPRQRDQRRSSTPTPTCCSSRSTSRRCIPGTGPASDVGLGRGRGLHGQPAGARRHAATRPTARWSSTSACALIARLGAAARARLAPASTPTATTRWRPAGSARRASRG